MTEWRENIIGKECTMMSITSCESVMHVSDIKSLKPDRKA